jgi:hypothetical protein
LGIHKWKIVCSGCGRMFKVHLYKSRNSVMIRREFPLVFLQAPRITRRSLHSSVFSPYSSVPRGSTPIALSWCSSKVGIGAAKKQEKKKTCSTQKTNEKI